jgi:membrane protein implicated in regulation of membrane protease activity
MDWLGDHVAAVFLALAILLTERITGLEAGRIKLSGEIWSAKPYDETLTIDPGQTVEVLEIRGATAYVHPVPSLES